MAAKRMLLGCCKDLYLKGCLANLRMKSFKYSSMLPTLRIENFFREFLSQNSLKEYLARIIVNNDSRIGKKGKFFDKINVYEITLYK